MPLTKIGRGTGLAVAVDLVNTWDELEDDPELIEGLADVRFWLTWHGLNRAAKEVKAERKGRELHNFAAFLARVPDDRITDLWMVEARPAYSAEFWA